MANRRLFLDTQQWNYLVAKPGCSNEDLAEARTLLKRRVVYGEWEVIGSLPLLQELMGTAPRNREKYEQMCKLIFDVVGSHWLLPLDKRYAREITYGGLLPENGRCVSRDIRRKIKRLAGSLSQVNDIADATHTEVEAFKSDQEHIRKQVFARLTPAERPRNAPDEMKKWWDRRDLEGWVKSVVTDGIRRGKLSADSTYVVSETTMPSAWRIVDFKQARIRLNLGDGRSISRGDYFDADMYGCSPYFDVLVTDDRPFRETCQLLDSKDLAFSDFDGLLALLRNGA